MECLEQEKPMSSTLAGPRAEPQVIRHLVLSLELPESSLHMASPLPLCVDVILLSAQPFQEGREGKGTNIYGAFLGARH